MKTDSPATHDATRPVASGVERWLRSPVRLAFLATFGVLCATAATVLGEVELRSAGGLGAEEAEFIKRKLAVWIGWALLTPAIVGASVWLARRRVAWLVIVLLHVPVALVVSSAILAAEIKAQEIAQGPERTEWHAERLAWIEGMLEDRQQAIDEGRAPWGRDRGRRGRRDDANGDRADDRPGEGSEEARAAEAPPRDGPPPEDAEQRDERRGRRGFDRVPDRGPEWGHERGRGGGRFRPRGMAQNVATGNLVDDFGRRWPLRVPRYALIYFTLLGIGLGIRAYLVGRTKEREAQELKERTGQLEQALTESRLEALKGQLHPHFLFNALHSVGGLVRSSRGPEALTALDSIGDLLRTSLDAGPEQFVPLERELELIERYLAVESLRLGDRLTVTVDVHAALRDVEVPAFIAQPLVENAIKHGIATRPEGGHVTIRAAAAEDGENLVIDIEDDGPGSPTGADDVSARLRAEKSEGGVGLGYIRGRLDALFADGADLTTANLPAGGFRARLRLPLEDL